MLYKDRRGVYLFFAEWQKGRSYERIYNWHGVDLHSAASRQHGKMAQQDAAQGAMRKVQGSIPLVSFFSICFLWKKNRYFRHFRQIKLIFVLYFTL
jgi:hypothetical protein